MVIYQILHNFKYDDMWTWWKQISGVQTSTLANEI